MARTDHAVGGDDFVTYVSLTPAGGGDSFQDAPTIASGDFQLSIDGGAYANLTNLPTVAPAGSDNLKIVIAAAEIASALAATNPVIAVRGRDASGAEWQDIKVIIPCYATAPTRTADIPTTAEINAEVDTAISDAALATAADLPANFGDLAITVATGLVDVNDKTGFALSAVGIQAIWDALTSALTTVGSIGKLLVDNIDTALSGLSSHSAADVRTEMDSNSTKLDVAVSTRLATAGYTAPDNASIATILTDVGTDGVVVAAASKTGYRLSATGVDDILDEAIVEPSMIFTWPTTLRNIAGWIGALARNKMTQTNTTSTLRNDADDGNIATSGVSDDGTTFTRGEWT